MKGISFNRWVALLLFGLFLLPVNFFFVDDVSADGNLTFGCDPENPGSASISLGDLIVGSVFTGAEGTGISISIYIFSLGGFLISQPIANGVTEERLVTLDDSQLLAWKIINETDATILKLSTIGNLGISGSFYESGDGWDDSQLLAWKIINETDTTILRLSIGGNLTVTGLLYEDTVSPPEGANIVVNMNNSWWLGMDGSLYIKESLFEES